MIVYLNPSACHGTAKQRWMAIENDVRSAVSDGVLEVIETQETINRDLTDAVERGHKQVVAAGGDGTVHFIANEIMKLPEPIRRSVIFGALALGSSNDFHKSTRRDYKVNDSLAPISANSSRKRNLILCNWTDISGKQHAEYTVVNLSIGLVANGNDIFNKGGWVLRAISRQSVDLAINYTATIAVLGSRNAMTTIEVDGIRFKVALTNLGVVINPNFAGDCRYDTDVTPFDDYMCVNLCEGMGLLRKLSTFMNLQRGRFTGLPGTKSWKAKEVRVERPEPFPLEMDGEVRQICSLHASLLRDALQVYV